MVHRICLFKLKDAVTEETVESMMRNARMQLLKISEVLNIRCGKRIDADQPWRFFIAIECESTEKLKIIAEDPIYVTFSEKSIKPFIEAEQAMNFEMEPFKDVRYS